MKSNNFSEAKCPVCGSKELMSMDGESICMGECCPWNSSQQSVEAGSMDYLLQLDWDEIEKSEHFENGREEPCEEILSETFKVFEAQEAV